MWMPSAGFSDEMWMLQQPNRLNCRLLLQKNLFFESSDNVSSTIGSSQVDDMYPDPGPLASESSDQMIRFNLFHFLSVKKFSSICPEKTTENSIQMLLQQCRPGDDTKHDASEVSGEVFTQSFSIMNEKLRQRAEANNHPFMITQPVAFSEKMLTQFDSFPTAKTYLQAYKLLKEGLEVLYKSNFTDARGISLIARGYLTENAILQAFSLHNELLTNILQLCEENLIQNPCFFEGLLLSFALCGNRYKSGGKGSEESVKVDNKRLMGITNLIHYIEKAEPNSLPSKDPFEFDKNYSSWLHVLYCHMAATYTIAEASEKAAEAFENSLKCCPSYFDAKRGLGYNLMNLLLARTEKCNQDEPIRLPSKFYEQTPIDREISKYNSWTTETLRDTAVKVLQEYLEEAPHCAEFYPNACYYLAQCTVLDRNMSEFRKYYELGQDAEEKRLPFLEHVDLPIKDMLSPFYQHFANVKLPVSCGNKSCTKKVKERDLKSCACCRKQKYRMHRNTPVNFFFPW